MLLGPSLGSGPDVLRRGASEMGVKAAITQVNVTDAVVETIPLRVAIPSFFAPLPLARNAGRVALAVGAGAARSRAGALALFVAGRNVIHRIAAFQGRSGLGY